jgi:hypothetical protein
MSIVSGTVAAFKGSDAIKDAAKTSADAQTYIYNDTKKRFEPYEEVGKNALPGLKGFDAAHPTPSFEETVSKPMEGWNYEQSPAYKAKYTIGMEELNKQLQARGLAPSGVGATRAADLNRRLTSEDYNAERSYRTGQLTDLYKGRLSENTDRYNKILDQIKVGTGASASLGQAGNQYADSVGKNAMAVGEAQANLYSGLGGLSGKASSTGLKAYDTWQKAGWWGGSGAETTGSAVGAGYATTTGEQTALADYYGYAEAL